MKDKKEKKAVLVSEIKLVNLEAEASDEKNICPECSLEDVIVTVGHCKTCLACGWSLCGL